MDGLSMKSQVWKIEVLRRMKRAWPVRILTNTENAFAGVMLKTSSCNNSTALVVLLRSFTVCHFVFSDTLEVSIMISAVSPIVVGFFFFAVKVDWIEEESTFDVMGEGQGMESAPVLVWIWQNWNKIKVIVARWKEITNWSPHNENQAQLLRMRTARTRNSLRD